MGLDVNAYSGCAKLDVVFDANGEPIDPNTRKLIDYDKYIRIYLNPDFPGRANEFEDKAFYSYKNSASINCGAYSRYNRWRDDLAKLAGYPVGQYEQYGTKYDSHCVPCWTGETGPFSELINFSDCEGVIGASVSKKLAADFAEFQTKANAHHDEYFRKKYTEWRTAFDLASDSGCVRFS